MARMGSGLGQTSPAGERSRNPDRSTARRIDGLDRALDLHIGMLVRPEREMNRLVDTINALRPDLAVQRRDLSMSAPRNS